MPVAARVNNGVGLFVPAITSAGLARRYGIADRPCAELDRSPVRHACLVTTLAGDERLYRVPDSARFSFPAGGSRVTKVLDSGNGSFTLSTSGRAGRLQMAVTALPGWHLSIDGHATAVASVKGLAGVELSAEVPSGAAPAGPDLPAERATRGAGDRVIGGHPPRGGWAAGSAPRGRAAACGGLTGTSRRSCLRLPDVTSDGTTPGVVSVDLVAVILAVSEAMPRGSWS